MFSGRILYGDDFTLEQIEQWYRDEEEASYKELGADYAYNYYAVDWWHMWRHIPTRRWKHLLAFGGAACAELKHTIQFFSDITVLEPSESYANDRFRYVKPAPSGIMPFDDNAFDIITCFGVLHHIPNVSTIIREFWRVLQPGGFALVREPITSMGDWRFPRPGNTPHERGIPLRIFDSIIAGQRFDIVHRGKCGFRPIRKFAEAAFNSRVVAAVDAAICRFPWPITYHATRPWLMIAPSSVTYVLKKTH